MQKKSTHNLHLQIANNTMYYIYENIDTDINLDDLAYKFAISRHHFQKIFKEQMGINIYETIKSSRLQKASNLLLTNKYSTITQIANICGYSSQTSFIRAFKKRFNQTPKQWRNGGFKEYSTQILKKSTLSSYEEFNYDDSNVKIIKAKARRAYYIRQKGYSEKEGKKVWQKLQAWIYTNDIKEYEHIGIYHDNPTITAHHECFYVAGVIPKNDMEIPNTNLPYFYTPEAIYATFEIKGKIGDVLRFTQWAYHEWLPKSGFETTTSPPYAIFQKNQFIESDESFEATYYLPIKYS